MQPVIRGNSSQGRSNELVRILHSTGIFLWNAEEAPLEPWAWVGDDYEYSRAVPKRTAMFLTSPLLLGVDRAAVEQKREQIRLSELEAQDSRKATEPQSKLSHKVAE